MLLLGFAAWAELVGIDREHVSFVPSGIRLLIVRSKTDAQGDEAEIGIPRGKRADTCPVRALECSAWHWPVHSARNPDRPLGFWGLTIWAWRRGHRYCTVMVDLETNNVVDLLPDREAATVATWLRGRPGVEIVARSGPCAAAPDSISFVPACCAWHSGTQHGKCGRTKF